MVLHERDVNCCKPAVSISVMSLEVLGTLLTTSDAHFYVLGCIEHFLTHVFALSKIQ